MIFEIVLVSSNLLLILFTTFYLYFHRLYHYWSSRNIYHAQPVFPSGSFQGANVTRNVGQIFADIYLKHPGRPVVGAWAWVKPMLVIRDVKLIKTILVKEFTKFHDRGFYVDVEGEPMAGNLFFMNGHDWRNLRIKLSPTFTSGKLKNMFPTMITVGERFKKVLEEPAEEGSVLEVKEYLSRYTTDVIASVAFGLDVNCLTNPESEFRVIGRSLQRPPFMQRTAIGLYAVIPKIAKFLRLRVFEPAASKFFLNIVKDTIQEREERNIQRNDFMQLLIQLKNKGYIDDADASKNESTEEATQKFTVEQAAAQAFVFFIGGFETSSGTLQFALYELARQPDIQSKLREEMDEVTARHGSASYEAFMDMEYLDRIVSETLRMYPIAVALARVCNEDFTFPDTDIVVEKGVGVIISTLGLHHDPRIYPKPGKFDPDRFSPEEKAKRDHYAYLPFGEGPRICIGNRFALMQIKVALWVIISNFIVEVCEKTTIPVVIDPKVDMLTPKGGMHLKLRKRTPL